MPLGGLIPYGPGQQPQMNGMQQAGQPQQGAGQKGSAGKFNPIQTVLQQPLQLLSQIISQQMMQASQMGVPYTHLLDQLMQTANQAGQGAGMALAGGGNQPPGGPPGPGGGGPPPQPPQGPGWQDESSTGMSQPATGNINQAFVGQQPGQAGAGGAMASPGAGFNPQAALGGMPTAQETAGRFIQPAQGGSGFNRMGPQGQFVPGGMLGGMFGLSADDYARIQAGNAANPANQAQQKAVEAAITPATQAERLNTQATGMKQVLDMEKADTADFNKATENYRIVLPRYATIREMITNPQSQKNNGFADLGLINEVLKVIDPPTANREGEVKTWTQAESRFKRAGNALSGGWYDGRKLTASGRKQILHVMTTKFNEVTKDAGRYHQAYSKKIRGYGGDPERALTRVSLDDQQGGSGVKITSIKEIK